MTVQVRMHLRDRAFAKELSALVSESGAAQVKCSTSDKIAPFIAELSEEMLLVVDQNEIDVRALLDTLSYGRKSPFVIVLNNRDTEMAKANIANSIGSGRATILPRTSAKQVANHIARIAERSRQRLAPNDIVSKQTSQFTGPHRPVIFDPVFIEELLEQAPVGVLVTTLRYEVQFINRYGAELLGCNEFDMVGQTLAQLAPKLSGDFLAKAEQRDKPPGAGPVEVEVGQNHRRRVLTLLIVPLSGMSELPESRLIILQDATVAKDALIRANQANEAKSQFLANASHELRTPLNAILGYAELLMMAEDGNRSSAPQQYAENIHAGGKHLLRIANDLIDLAKLESGSLDVSLERIDAFEIVRDCVTLTNPIAIRDGVSVHLHPPQARARFVIADLLRLKQCVLNLVSNAIKYGVDAGNVSIRMTRASDEYIQIYVEDDGIGMPAETQENLFEMFVTSNQEAPKAHERGGLGLYLTKRLIESMSGFISFESQEGKGSTFCLEIPAADKL